MCCSYNEAPTTTSPLPRAIIRAASDHDSSTVQRSPDDPRVWLRGTPVEEDIGAGYAFAIGTSSTAALEMLAMRCKADGGTDCAWSLRAD